MSRWLWLVLASSLLGAAAALADVWVQPGPGYEWKLAFSLVTNAASLWAGLGLLAGWLLRRPLPAALGGPIALGAATTVYYLVAARWGDRYDVGALGVLGTALHWLVVAAVAGPVLGLVGAAMRRADAVGWLACAVLPAGVALDMWRFHHLDRESFQILPVSAWAQVAMIVLAVLLAVLAPRRARRRTEVGPDRILPVAAEAS